MRFDVATFTSMCLITFLCCALITTALSHMFRHVTAFRFWTVGFFLLCAASACFALHMSWDTDLLLIATATLALQSRILIWSGTRELFGAKAPWRYGLLVTAVFGALYAAALAFKLPLVLRGCLLALFFLPCRAATLYEAFRRRRPRLGPARLMVALGSVIASLNGLVPLTLVLLNHGNLSLLLGNPQNTSAVYAVVFAGDLLLASGLIVLAFQLQLVERDMLATLDRSALRRLAESRETRTQRGLLSSAAPFGRGNTPSRRSLRGML
ncbi:hypothetical protein P3T18_004082 [Paraburkholderia sp. GAS199]|uniref:hypothetical protein n=1 Tax=Paraburkholderia sp. GAS199 TaxID=3035126 RepID=UPI003D1D25DB